MRRMEAIWKITPFITMVLTLAVVSLRNATVLAYGGITDARELLFGSKFKSPV